jgi:hypothetical protein
MRYALVAVDAVPNRCKLQSTIVVPMAMEIDRQGPGRPVRQKTTPLDHSVTRQWLGPGLDSGRKVLGEPLRRESSHFLESSWFLEQVSGSRNDD